MENKASDTTGLIRLRPMIKLSDWLTQLTAKQPDSVLLLTDLPPKTFSFLSASVECLTVQDWLNHPAKRYALAICCHALNTLTRMQCEQVLARLRDVDSQHVLVAEDQIALARSDFYSLGFSGLPVSNSTEQLLQDDLTDNQHLMVYQYNIFAYKQVPDWLNAKNWANPELWGKYHW